MRVARSSLIALLLTLTAVGAAASPALATQEQATIVAPADGSLSSSPQESPPHHAPFGGDWAADIAGAAGRPVYARFSNESGALGLTVLGTFEPCAAPNQGTAGVGLKVQVTVDGVNLGVVNYLHLADAHAPGTIANGEQIGTEVAGTATSCWSGPHVHVEPRNEQKYACFQDRALNSGVDSSTKLGVIGGEYATGQNQLCPAGAVDHVESSSSPPPPPPVDPPPTVNVRRAHQGLANIRHHGLRLRVRCNEACSAGALLVLDAKAARRHGFKHARKRVLIGAGSASLAPSKAGTLVVKLTRAARRRLRSKVTVRLLVVGTDSGGNKTPVTRRYTLRR